MSETNQTQNIIIQVFNSGIFNFQNGLPLTVNKPSYLISFKDSFDFSLISTLQLPVEFLRPIDTFLASNVMFLIILFFVTTSMWTLVFTNLLFNNANNSLDITFYLDNQDVGTSRVKLLFYYSKILLVHVLKSFFKNDMSLSLGCYFWSLCTFFTRFANHSVRQTLSKQFKNNYMSFEEYGAREYTDGFNLFILIFLQLLYIGVFVQLVYNCCCMTFYFEKSVKQKRSKALTITIICVFGFCLLFPHCVFEACHVVQLAAQSNEFLKMMTYFEDKNKTNGLPYTMYFLNDVAKTNEFLAKYILQRTSIKHINYSLISNLFNFIANVIMILCVFLPSVIIAQRKLTKMENLFIENLHKYPSNKAKVKRKFQLWNFCRYTLPSMISNVAISLCLLALILINVKSITRQYSLKTSLFAVNGHYTVFDASTNSVITTSHNDPDDKGNDTIPPSLRWMPFLISFFQLLQFSNFNSVLNSLKLDLEYCKLKYKHLTYDDDDDSESFNDQTDENLSNAIANSDLKTMSVFTFTTKKSKSSKISMFEIPTLIHVTTDENSTRKSNSATVIEEEREVEMTENSTSSEDALPTFNHEMTEF